VIFLGLIPIQTKESSADNNFSINELIKKKTRKNKNSFNESLRAL